MAFVIDKTRTGDGAPFSPDPMLQRRQGFQSLTAPIGVMRLLMLCEDRMDSDSYLYTVDAAGLSREMLRHHSKNRSLRCTCESLTRDIELIQASFKNLGAFHTLEDTRIGGVPIICCPKCFSTRMASRRHLAKTKHSVLMWHQMVVTRAYARSALNPPRSESRPGALQHKHRV